MDNNVIVTTPTQLQNMINEAVGAIIPKLAEFRRKNEAVEVDAINIEDAARFIAEQGVPTTRATLYNLVYRNSIPYRKIGRRLLFSRKELLQWLDSRTTCPGNSKADAALKLAESARKK